MPRTRVLPILSTLLLLIAGCGTEPSTPPNTVDVVGQESSSVAPTSYTPPTATWSTGGQVASYVVPAGSNKAEFQLWGGGGGGGAPGAGGGGAWVQASFPVVAGDTLEVRVASGGAARGGGGGASYVLRNGQVMLIAAGGGGGGVDGCGGCSMDPAALTGAGGGGGPAGGSGQSGRSNEYLQTNSGAGTGGTQSAGGAAGISNDQNPYGYDECTSHGFAGAANQGGAARVCTGGTYTPSNFQLGGQGIGNGSGGGGGAGRYGGGSGAHKWTYTGGGGGGGSSWVHPNATLIATTGGEARQPGGTQSPDYASSAGLGGAPQTSSFGTPPQPGASGLITLRVTGSGTAPTATWSTGGQVASYVVPAGKSRAEFQLWGGGGGGGAPGAGGGGAWVQASFPVVAGDTLEVRVASGGAARGGGGGASYVLRNGQVMLIAAGGGGGGVDGCSGCSLEQDALAGAAGAGGPAGGNGQGGRPNNYLQTNSGAGGGATQSAGGAAGISNDQNPYGYDECTSHGFAGTANQGGAARSCPSSSATAASFQLGGQGIGNGSGGGGGAGWYGGGGGALKWTYTGGGGGGGSSWTHSTVTLIATSGGDARQPGGTTSPDYTASVGLGGAPQTGPFGPQPQPGASGLITLRL
ncbi:hypothetical protein [Pyxidicoccus xibeiensis]|uniref:hypothetical protein n=1 Tax=Pyxidicoccus xibeiensis TaxID=2906759 RepID=UPI0020A72597|nr:hypothetical protein [Pyxidicoccus xibeiensis]MCP3144319.1 hypothetical protein [Pyxidicoccus xibeiensis]